MIKAALIIHGAFGSSNENWFPWLKAKLEHLGYKVLIPTLPTPENQNLESWEKIARPYLAQLNEDSIVVGHSLGVPFGLRVLEILSTPIKAFYGAAGFVDLLDNRTFDEINKTFTERNFDWEKIQAQAGNFYLYHGDNDPYVSMVCAENLAKKLNTNIQVIINGGHLNEGMGFTEFLQLLNDINKL